MTSDIQLPQIDDLTNQARIVRWFKEEGEFVADNESLLEIEDGLSNMVIHNTSGAGILRNIYKQLGEVVLPGERVADFQFFFLPTKDKNLLENLNAPDTTSSQETEKKINATESAIKFANEHQIDLSLLVDQASGENGEITDEDVIQYFTHSLIEIDNQRLAVTDSDDNGLLSNIQDRISENQSMEDALTAEIEKALLEGENEVVERKPIKIPRITNLPFDEQDATPLIQPHTWNDHFSIFEATFDFSQTEQWLTKTIELISDQESLNKYGYSAIFLKAIDWVLQHEKDFIAPLLNPEDFGVGFNFLLHNQSIVHGMSNLPHKTCGQIANELLTAFTKYQQGQKITTNFQRDPKFVFFDLLTYGIDHAISYPTGLQFALLTAGTIQKHQVRISPDLTQVKSTRQITLVVNKDNINEASAIHFFYKLRTVIENPSIILF